MSAPSLKRLVIVSNRLPFNVAVEDGELRYTESAGGLVSGLEAYLSSFESRRSPPISYIWVGWPGNTIAEDVRTRLRKEAFERFRSHPIFLSEDEMDLFYNGFCNKTIWPLFHYFPSYTSYQEEHWKSYLRVNEMFCEGLMEVVHDDDIVWVHDYHLMLLPKLLRERGCSAPIGFFLHIPFPSYEVFRLIPRTWRQEILEGIVGADLVGFHTFEYTQNFLQSVLRVLGYEHNLGQISLPTHLVKVETFPMGIDFEKFFTAATSPEVLQRRQNLESSLGKSHVILSVDRLDYSKGILNRLEGYELLLERHAELHGSVVLIMVVIPSRVMVDQYEKMKKQIEESVGKINGKFGAVGWTPIVYQYRSLPFASLVALYSISDVALVTPLRDGMNLVAKEYIATRADGTGVLVLSEMAGAAKELGEAIIVNPNYREEVAEALHEALTMPVEEQKRRNRIMQARLRRYTVSRWADEFIQRLTEMRSVQEKFLAKLLPSPARQKLLKDYKVSKRRLLLLDYDGTLAPFERYPGLARPSTTLVNLLDGLASDSANTVVVISGRDKETLDAWLGGRRINLAAEHGLWLRDAGSAWALLKQQTNEWKTHVYPLMQMYADRLPGSFVEEKDYSLAWHYRTADPEQAQAVVGELADNLVNFTATIGLQVLRGNKVIEVRGAGINKGAAAMHWLTRGNHDFVLAIGDDLTDEDLFQALPQNAYSIRVGVANTLAHFNVRDSREVIRLLESLVKS